MTEQQLPLIPDPEPTTWELIGLWMMGDIEDWPCQKSSRHSG